MGGLAVQRWGEPRLTRDVDLTLLVGFGSEESYIDPLLKEFGARVEEPRQFALEHRVLLLRDANGVPLDLALGALPFEERTIERSSNACDPFGRMPSGDSSSPCPLFPVPCPLKTPN